MMKIDLLSLKNGFLFAFIATVRRTVSQAALGVTGPTTPLRLFVRLRTNLECKIPSDSGTPLGVLDIIIVSNVKL